jgi:phosphatidylserine/phosphatidylglycerophosphate/cardiolipin synthase-like enzyme
VDDVFQPLSDADLDALAGALRSGKLSSPFSMMAVQHYCSPADAGRVAGRMRELSEEGLRPAHLALLLETISRTRKQRPPGSDLVELVCTGPETRWAAFRDTGVVVRELFAAAREQVLVVGYAVYRGKEVFRVLAGRMAELPGLKVRLFLDVQRGRPDTSLDSEVVARFGHRFRTREWPGQHLPELYYDPRSLERDRTKRASLHAKCVVIDRRVALVSSANFTEAAQVRNIEVGALVHSARFAAELAEHFERLALTGELLPLP